MNKYDEGSSKIFGSISERTLMNQSMIHEQIHEEIQLQSKENSKSIQVEHFMVDFQDIVLQKELVK